MENGFTRQELSDIKRLNEPDKLQGFVNSLRYFTGKRLCPVNVLRQKKGDCVAAAVFACAVLDMQKTENFLIDLRSVRDEDHVLCVYKKSGFYGSIAQSKFLDLKGRQPVYLSVRELVMSYFEHYFNFFGELTLREFSGPLRLSVFGKGWINSDKLIYDIAGRLDKIKHYRILPDKAKLPLVSKEKFYREILIFPENVRIGKRYRKE